MTKFTVVFVKLPSILMPLVNVDVPAEVTVRVAELLPVTLELFDQAHRFNGEYHGWESPVVLSE